MTTNKDVEVVDAEVVNVPAVRTDNAPAELPRLAPEDRIGGNLLTSPAALEHLQRVSKMWAASKLVPDIYKGDIATCAMATSIANEMGVHVLFLMQRLYPIKGKWGIEGQLYIGLANASGVYQHGIQYKLTGEGASRTCVAYGQRTDNGEVESAEVSMEMARLEGWLGKDGSKWKTMPDHMLKLRSAAFLIREYHPELTHGLHMKEELVDMGDGTAVVRRARPASELNATLEKLSVKDSQSNIKGDR